MIPDGRLPFAADLDWSESETEAMDDPWICALCDRPDSGRALTNRRSRMRLTAGGSLHRVHGARRRCAECVPVRHPDGAVYNAGVAVRLVQQMMRDMATTIETVSAAFGAFSKQIGDLKITISQVSDELDGERY